MKKGNGTSLFEQSIYHYVKLFFSDAINRYKYNDSIEVDVYIPSIKIAIEYDGFYWHEKSVEKDIEKNAYLNSNNIIVIRVRDGGLPNLPPFNGKIIVHNNGKFPGLHKEECINEILHYLSSYAGVSKSEELLNFQLTYEEYSSALPQLLIYKFNTPLTESVYNNKNIMPFWSNEKNGSLDPKCVPEKCYDRLWFDCPCGKTKLQLIPRYCTAACRSKECNKCFYQICPFLNECQDNCSYIQNIINSLSITEIPISKQNGYIDFKRKLHESSYLTEYILKRIKNELNANEILIFESIFFPGMDLNTKKYRWDDDPVCWDMLVFYDSVINEEFKTIISDLSKMYKFRLRVVSNTHSIKDYLYGPNTNRDQNQSLI